MPPRTYVGFAPTTGSLLAVHLNLNFPRQPGRCRSAAATCSPSTTFQTEVVGPPPGETWIGFDLGGSGNPPAHETDKEE
jgi:hypothetical protein